MKLTQAALDDLLKSGRVSVAADTGRRVGPAAARLQELQMAAGNTGGRVGPAAARLKELQITTSSTGVACDIKNARRRSARTRKAKGSPHEIALRWLEKNPESYYLDREYYDQIRVFHHMELYRPELYEAMAAMPNGGLRSPGTAGKMKASGQKKGYPDIILDLPRGIYHGLRIEMKVAAEPERGLAAGTIGQHQVEYLRQLSARGYYCCVCYGSADAIEAILRYAALASAGVMPYMESDLLWAA